jgi:hypothetical protein
VSPDLAARLAATALGNVTTEFPYAPAHVVAGPDDRALPRTLHPVFYGSFDWHSAVHMHWLLVRLLRTGPVDRAAVEAVLDTHLTPERVAVEAGYLRAHPGFERPYGWGWLLLLAAECAGTRWAAALEPAVATVADLVLDWLPRAGRPVRHGTHDNAAFALGLALDAAGPLDRPDLAAAVRTQALAWFAGDRDAPARWEPSGEDFLSPALCEADLLRRLLPGPELATWLDGFLPGLVEGHPLLAPVEVSDRTDGRLGHLDGLNLSRAAALRSIAGALPAGDPRPDLLRRSAAAHLDAALPALTGSGYESNHWLGSFAVLALSA